MKEFAAPVPSGRPWTPKGKLLQEPLRPFVIGECRALIVGPSQILLVEPNEHRRGPGYDAKRVGKADLVMAFGKDGKIDADKLGRQILEHRSCGKHEMCRLE